MTPQLDRGRTNDRRDVETEWTDARIEKLRGLWTEGLSTAEIGRRMDISKSAVVGKARRLDLAARPSPIKRDGPSKPQAPRRPSGPTLPRLAVETLAIAIAAEVRKIEARLPPVAVMRMPTPKPRIKECCWPVGERGNVRSCDGPVVRGSYCAEHAARGYITHVPQTEAVA